MRLMLDPLGLTYVIKNEVMLITKDGQIVRTKVADISVIGRATQGVRCISLNEGDKLVSVARVPSTEAEGAEAAEETPDGRSRGGHDDRGAVGIGHL